MKNNILTAEEFLNQEEYYSVSNDFDTQQSMIEFAKIHVKEALKEVNKITTPIGTGEWSYLHVDDKSILNAYNLNNIK